MNDLMNIGRSLLYGSRDLDGRGAFDNKTNRKILICTVLFIKDSHRFNDSLLYILSSLLDFANSNILTSLFLKVCVSNMTLVF